MGGVCIGRPTCRLGVALGGVATLCQAGFPESKCGERERGHVKSRFAGKSLMSPALRLFANTLDITSSESASEPLVARRGSSAARLHRCRLSFWPQAQMTAAGWTRCTQRVLHTKCQCKAHPSGASNQMVHADLEAGDRRGGGGELASGATCKSSHSVRHRIRKIRLDSCDKLPIGWESLSRAQAHAACRLLIEMVGV